MDASASASTAPADPPRGRRPRPSRPHVIKFRASQEEYDLLQTKAQQANTTVTALLRDHIHRAQIAPQDGTACLVEVHRIRVNMETLLEWCRTYKGLAETAIILAHLVALEREVARLTEGVNQPTPKGFGRVNPPAPKASAWQKRGRA